MAASGTVAGFEYRGAFEAFLELAAKRLRDAEFLAGTKIKVVSQADPRNDVLSTMRDVLVDQKLGQLILVIFSGVRGRRQGLVKQVEFEFTCKIFENARMQATLRGHGKSGLWLAEWVAETLHGWADHGHAGAQVVMLTEEDPIGVDNSFADQGVGVYDVTFSIPLTLCPVLTSPADVGYESGKQITVESG